MDDDFELDDEEDDVLALFSVFFHRKKRFACAQMRSHGHDRCPLRPY